MLKAIHTLYNSVILGIEMFLKEFNATQIMEEKKNLKKKKKKNKKCLRMLYKAKRIKTV